MSQLRLNRMTVQRDIRSLIGTNAANTKTKFEPNRDNDATTASLRVPPHQRFYVWPEQKRHLLVDSIMNNCPLPLMVFTEQVINGGSAWFVQDGQQRLITLQKFIMGEFTWNEKRYDELDDDDRLNFLGYTVTCEIIKNPTQDQIANIFERLNCGKPLTDNDKFWNRRESAVVSFTMNELIRHEDLREHFRKYVGAIGAGKSRSQLSDIIGAVVAIARNSVDCIATSFDKVGVYVCEEISEETKTRVITVFKEYFSIISASLQKHSVSKPRKLYIKLTGMLGMYLFWRIHPDHFINDAQEQETLRDSIKCWGWFAWKLQDNNFKKDYFAVLPQGAQRNLGKEALSQRTEYLMSEFRLRNEQSLDNTLESLSEITNDSDDDESNSSDDEDSV